MQKTILAEAQLARKASPKRQAKSPRVVEGRVHKRKETPSDTDTEGSDKAILGPEQTKSPAAERAAGLTVKRATHGLIRLEARRRVRTFFRRLLILLLLCGAVYGAWYYLSDSQAFQVVHDYWEQIRTKVTDAINPEKPEYLPVTEFEANGE